MQNSEFRMQNSNGSHAMRVLLRRKALLGFVSISIVAVGIWAISAPLPAQGPKAGAKGPPPPPKGLVTAAPGGTVAKLRTFVGTVKPSRRSLIGSAAAGRIEQYLINEGDLVKAGQPIAHLRRGVITAELNVAKGDLAVREAELGELQKSYQEEI